MRQPRICIIKFDGTNCDEETAHAFELAHGMPRIVHINLLRDRRERLADYQIVVLAGGFSYGDDIVSGKVAAIELNSFLKDELRQLIDSSKLILGICNGFQILARTGLLPFGDQGTMSITLTNNAVGHFVCRWITLVENTSPCVFTQGIERIELTVANGEGRIFASDETLTRIEQQKLVALRYIDRGGQQTPSYYGADPSGSANNIAGMCDPTGRIFGLMPHPERYVASYHHPNWRRSDRGRPQGLAIFDNAVRAAAEL